ncbi:hypothetical protein [Symbioplanes lichenis]|uniref:hypothetical protein n=1 Tax=Symbioplanes lichenis TaxID=1629072 RepID=UPI002738E8DB|nr:hypothetical protein [Actinoplanes lichenis]
MPARDLPPPPPGDARDLRLDAGHPRPGTTGPLPGADGLRLDADEAARRKPAAAIVPVVDAGAGKSRTAPAHHGAGDPRQAARERSGRARAGRGTPGGGRSYAFRRS